MNEKMLKELQKWVKDNYNPHTTDYTPERSAGNSYDCFYDGEQCATSWCAYEVGKILGMALEEPDMPEEEEY